MNSGASITNITSLRVIKSAIIAKKLYLMMNSLMSMFSLVPMLFIRSVLLLSFRNILNSPTNFLLFRIQRGKSRYHMIIKGTRRCSTINLLIIAPSLVFQSLTRIPTKLLKIPHRISRNQNLSKYISYIIIIILVTIK